MSRNGNDPKTLLTRGPNNLLDVKMMMIGMAMQIGFRGRKQWGLICCYIRGYYGLTLIGELLDGFWSRYRDCDTDD